LNLNQRSLVLRIYIAETCKEYDAKLFHYVSVANIYIYALTL